MKTSIRLLDSKYTVAYFWTPLQAILIPYNLLASKIKFYFKSDRIYSEKKC